jgi:hypothetical protein
MTSSATPGSELLDAISVLERDLKGLIGAVLGGDSTPQLLLHIGGLLVDVDKAARLAASPADDPAAVWDAYCAEVPASRRSPQSALAFGFEAGNAGKQKYKLEDSQP